MTQKLTKYSITALLLLYLLITSTAHAYAPVASAVARAFGNKQFRNLVLGSGLLVGGGGTVLTDIFGGDYNPDTPAPPPANNGDSGGVWITNGLDGSRAMSPQGSCNLLNEGHGVKLTFENGYRCTVYSPNLGGGSITYNTFKTTGDVWQNPKLNDIANDIVNQAKNGNKTALDIIRASEPPAPFDIDNATNDDLINWLNNNQADNSTADPANSSGTGTGGTGTGGNTDPVNPDNGGTGSNSNKDDKNNSETSDKKESFELPKFCNWATKVCDFVDWVKKEPEKEKTELDIEKQTSPNINTNIKFNAQCPNDIIVSGTWQGQAISITLFEWSKYCQFLIYLKYIIIAMASYGAVKIVGGVNVAD